MTRRGAPRCWCFFVWVAIATIEKKEEEGEGNKKKGLGEEEKKKEGKKEKEKIKKGVKTGVKSGRSLELHCHRCGLWSTFLSLLHSGPLGHWGGLKELWDKGARCSLTHTLFGPPSNFCFFFHFFEPIGLNFFEVWKFCEQVR